MSTKPLSVECRNVILRNMEANIRFRLTLQCPALKPTEMAVPLKIDYLNTFENGFKINEHLYTFGIFREYPKGAKIPLLHQEENELLGGSYEDLDEFGVSYNSEKTLAQRINDSQRSIESAEQNLSFAVKYSVENEIEMYGNELERERTNLMTLLNKRDNVLPSYSFCIQFSVSSPNWDFTEKLAYNMKISEALLKFSKLFFGFPRSQVFVKKWLFENQLAIETTPSLKFHVQDIVSNQSFLQDLDNVIDAKSYPLRCLEIKKCKGDMRNFSHPLAKSADKLIINGMIEKEIVSNLPNKEVELRNLDLNHVQIIREVIKNWIENGREIGASFSFQIVKSKVVKIMDQLEMVTEEYGGIRVSQRSIMIPFNYASEILISHDPAVIFTEGGYYDQFENGFHAINQNDRGVIKVTVSPL
ncbi:unnamed protein product [Caenorhabditis brenneri]